MFAEERDNSADLASGDAAETQAEEASVNEAQASPIDESVAQVAGDEAATFSGDVEPDTAEVAVSAEAESAVGGEEPTVGDSELVDSADEEEPDDDEEDEGGEVQPLELIEESEEIDEDAPKEWFILKVQVNRENSICDALRRKVKMEGLEPYFDEIVVPTEDVREFTKSGKQRVVKRKLYPGYILVHMALNDDTWFVVRETPGIGDFTGSAGKPTPMLDSEVERILAVAKPAEEGEPAAKAGIKYRPGDRVRVKEGYFQNFEGEVETIDESNGRITVMINIFGRPTPVELDHWQFEDI